MAVCFDCGVFFLGERERGIPRVLGPSVPRSKQGNNALYPSFLKNTHSNTRLPPAACMRCVRGVWGDGWSGVGQVHTNIQRVKQRNKSQCDSVIV